MTFEELNARIAPPDREAVAAAKKRWDEIAKPLGSLGRFEELLNGIAGLTGSARITLRPAAVLVACADNGVTRRGVAMTPPEITGVMSRFIAQKRSAVCLMAKAAGAETFAYDIGLFKPLRDEPGLIDLHVMDGTDDMASGPAMPREKAMEAIAAGMTAVERKALDGFRLLATGEMGIGNTTSTAAVTAVLLGLDPEKTTGRGVGLDDDAYRRKIETVRTAIRVNRPDPSDALDVLSKVGGLDIAAMAGMYIGAAIHRIPILIDGVISAAAALIAYRLCPACRIAMIPSHVSAEPSGSLLLDALGFSPLVHAGMRLGEGTGAALMFSMLNQILAVYDGLFTYADLGM